MENNMRVISRQTEGARLAGTQAGCDARSEKHCARRRVMRCRAQVSREKATTDLTSRRGLFWGVAASFVGLKALEPGSSFAQELPPTTSQGPPLAGPPTSSPGPSTPAEPSLQTQSPPSRNGTVNGNGFVNTEGRGNPNGNSNGNGNGNGNGREGVPQSAQESVPGVSNGGQTNGDVPAAVTEVPKDSFELTEEAAKKLLVEEEERRKQRKSRKGRIRELEEIRSELAEKELVLLEKEKELLERDQTLLVLREELELERKLRALLTKEKEKAEEEAALAMGLCSGANLLP